MTAPDRLIEELGEKLPAWLAEQRWFRAKARGVTSVRPLSAVELTDGLVHTLVEVDGAVYQLPLGVTPAVADHHLDHAVIGQVGDLTVHDATQDGDLMAVLLDLMVRGAAVADLRFAAEPAVTGGLRARPIGVEQSNTSIVYGQRYILKLYRQPDPGPNRDVELHRALAEGGATAIAAPLGTITAGGTVLGFLQEFLPDAVEGWATATASVRDLLAEADLHADEVGGDFAGESHRLGMAVAEIHSALARATGTASADQSVVDAEVDAMHARLDTVLAEVPTLAEDEPAIRAAFDRLRTLDSPLRVQHIHGDLHLGQVLRSNSGWVLIDFEGEPAATPAQRRTPKSPLRDVAAMLRSFDYAAFHLSAGGEETRQQTARATEWADRNRNAFLDGYAEVAEDPRSQPDLLRALELDKAVYEVRYEHHNRPDWLPIPLTAIKRRN